MLANYLYLVSDKLLRMAFGLVTNVLLLSYLSPVEFGSWNYVLSVAAIAGAVSIFSGLDVVVVRDLARARASEHGRIVGSVLVLRCLAGAAATAGSFAFVAWKGEWPLLWLILIVALSYFTQVLHALDYFFQSQLVPKFSALVLNATTTVGFLAKVILMWLHLLDLGLLCWILALESLLVGAGYLWLVVRNFGEVAPRAWRVDLALVRSYARTGVALLGSGLISVAIARVSIFQIDSNFDRASVAVFGLYALVFEAILLANYSLANAYFPRIIVKQATPSVYARDLCALAKRQAKLWAGTTGAFAVAMLAGRPWIEPFINPVYRQSLTMILFGLPVSALFIANFYLLQFLIIPQGNHRHQLARALLGLCVLLSANSVLFHASSVVMVVVSMALSQLAILSFTLFTFRKKINEFLAYGKGARMNRVTLFINALGRLPPFALKWMWPARFVLYGHLVSDRKDCMAAQRYRYPNFDEFERFRALAEKLDYRFVTLDEYVIGAFPRMILLTFDDGFYEVKEFYLRTRLPLVLFVVSEAFDNEAFALGVFAPRRSAFLRLEDILQLKQLGAHIGFHTRTHNKIRTLTDLENECSVPPQFADLLSEPPCFAYPFEGPADYRPVTAALIEAGYSWVFDTKFRAGTDGQHIFRIPMDRAHNDAVANPIIANVLQARLAELKRAWQWK